MNLYTEEEIVSFLKKEFADEIDAETFMENLTPIELPSDEEIDKKAYDDFKETIEKYNSQSKNEQQ